MLYITCMVISDAGLRHLCILHGFFFHPEEADDWEVRDHNAENGTFKVVGLMEGGEQVGEFDVKYEKIWPGYVLKYIYP